MKIYNVGNKSINLYLLDSGTHRLLIDSGYPNQLKELGRAIRHTGFKISDIDCLVVTHFHVDHAGAVQELKNEGVKFVLFDVQEDFIKPMEDMIAGKWKYQTLKVDDNLMWKIEESKVFLKRLNIEGQLIHTPGHTDDSISLMLDKGEVFTGDLPPEHFILDDFSETKRSWKILREFGANMAYPAHGSVYKL